MVVDATLRVRDAFAHFHALCALGRSDDERQAARREITEALDTLVRAARDEATAEHAARRDLLARSRRAWIDAAALGFGSRDGDHGWNTPDELTAAIAALRAERDALRQALTDISTWREDCHVHDADVGHEPRDFDEDELACIERHAAQALERRT